VAAEKLSISFDSELADAVRAAAADSGTSVSNWLAEAAQERVRQRYLREALDTVLAEVGPFDDAESAALVAEARRHSRVVKGRAGAA
jgi:hypothetical protein